MPESERPIVLICVITDGEAADINDFAQALVGMSSGIYVAIGIVGFGQEHDAALRSFQAVVHSQPRCKLVELREGASACPSPLHRSLRSVTPTAGAEELAQALESMFASQVSDYGWMNN